MIYSMTGFAQAKGIFGQKEISVEIKSLNSKFLDMRVKIPFLYRSKEHDIRRLIQDQIKRGKIEVTVMLNGMTESESYTINRNLFERLYGQLNGLKQDMDMGQADMMQAILRIPNVITMEDMELTEEEWRSLEAVIKEAIQVLLSTKRREGEVMEADIRLRIESILSLLDSIGPYEKQRVANIKDKLTKDLEEISSFHPIDKNRFEQEVLYYLEKLDITEEKVRLKEHCTYFAKVISDPNTENGKKLSFISQEIGREINTLGAKAQSSDIQKIVVEMKDELEKIKEQLANVQ